MRAENDLGWRRRRPARGEYGPFYAGYVAAVPDGDPVAALGRQGAHVADLFAGLPEARLDGRYAPGKWSPRELLGHLIDSERVFTFRAAAFARGDAGPFPGMDQDLWMAEAGFERRSRASLLAEYRHQRAAGVALFESLDQAAFARTGTASGSPFTVRALAWIVAGHERHHLAVLAERYGIGEGAP